MSGNTKPRYRSAMNESYITPVYVPTPPRPLPTPLPRLYIATTASLDASDTGNIPISRGILCSCVNYSKALLGHSGEIWGNASHMKPNIPIASASVGDVGITREGGGHVFVIASISEGIMITDEANYKRCASSSREFSFEDPSLKGFYRPPPTNSVPALLP